MMDGMASGASHSTIRTVAPLSQGRGQNPALSPANPRPYYPSLQSRCIRFMVMQRFCGKPGFYRFSGLCRLSGRCSPMGPPRSPLQPVERNCEDMKPIYLRLSRLVCWSSWRGAAVPTATAAAGSDCPQAPEGAPPARRRAATASASGQPCAPACHGGWRRRSGPRRAVRQARARRPAPSAILTTRLRGPRDYFDRDPSSIGP